MKIFAHRGGPSRAAENTIAAFKRAIDDGADGFECDVALTEDNEPVILHKVFYTDSISGLVDQGGRLRDLKWRDIRELTTNGEKIPHLNDVLEFVADHSDIECFLEPKMVSMKLIERIVDATHEYGVTQRVRLVTFFRRRALLQETKRLDSKLLTSVILISPFGEWVEKAKLANADIVIPGWKSFTPWRGSNHLRLLESLGLNLKSKVRTTRENGIIVYGGIADDEKNIKWLCAIGVDGIFTNDVPQARRVVSRRSECSLASAHQIDSSVREAP